MIDYSNPNNEYVLVTHSQGDVDCIVGVYRFLQAVGISVLDTLLGKRVRFEFVYPGDKIEDNRTDEVMIHIDTGGKFDPENGFFDHHFEGIMQYSATHLIDEYFQGDSFIVFPDDLYAVIPNSKYLMEWIERDTEQVLDFYLMQDKNVHDAVKKNPILRKWLISTIRSNFIEKFLCKLNSSKAEWLEDLTVSITVKSETLPSFVLNEIQSIVEYRCELMKSQARSMFLHQSLEGKKSTNPEWLNDLVEYANLVDSPATYPKLSEESYAFIRETNERVVEEIGDLGRFSPQYAGPTDFAKLVRQFPENMSDVDRMKLGLVTLESFLTIMRNNEDEEADLLAEVNMLLDSHEEKTRVPEQTFTADSEFFGELGRMQNRLLFVLPYSPMAVEILAVKLLLHIRKISINSSNVEFVFVDEKEQFFSDKYGDDWSVIHLNCGRVWNPKSLHLDTDSENCPFDNIVQAIYALAFHNDNRTPNYIRNLVTYMNFYESNLSEMVICEADWDKLNAYHRELAEKVPRPVRFNLNFRAPVHLPRVIDDLPSYLSDQQMMQIGLQLFDGFFEEMNTRTSVFNHLELSQRETGNGLTMACIPPNGFNTKTLRGILRKKFRQELDVYVAEFETDETDNDRNARFCVTTVINSAEVAGMDELMERLYRLDPELRRPSGGMQGDIYLHHSAFVLYINGRTSLKLAQVWETTLKTLRRVTQ